MLCYWHLPISPFPSPLQSSFFCFYSVVVVQLLNHIQLFATSWTVLHRLCHLLKLMSIESMMPSKHLILCCPLLLLPSIFPTSRSFAMNQLITWHNHSIISMSSACLHSIYNWYHIVFSFSFSLISPRIMPSRFIHVVTNGSIFLYLMAEKYSVGCLHVLAFVSDWIQIGKYWFQIATNWFQIG